MFEMQVKVIENNKLVWRSVVPSGNKKPYQYKTEKEAMHMLKICYPLQIYGEEVRVIKVN